MSVDDIQARVNEFGTKLQSHIDDMGMGFTNTPPPTLYHYTSAEGLLGILGNPQPKLHATHYKYLNDSTEYEYANILLNRAISKKLISASPVVRSVLQAVLDTPSGFLAFTDPYIACFCEKDDLLSQWRGYGAKGGYAIGFGTRPITMGVIGSQYTLHKVEYNPDKQIAVIEFLLEEFCKVVEEFSSAFDGVVLEPPLFELTLSEKANSVEMYVRLPISVQQYCMEFMRKYSLVAVCLKDPSFSVEEEWRLVHLRMKMDMFEPKFRAAGSLPVPYAELPLFIEGSRIPSLSSHTANFSLVSIRYGPSVHPVLARRSLELLRSTLKITDGHLIQIDGSKIPVKL